MNMDTPYDPYAAFIEPDQETLTALRNQCPVAKTPSGWFVSTHAGVKQVLQRIDDFRGGFTTWDGFPPDELPLSGMDEAEHSRVRKFINAAIGRPKSDSLEPFIRATANDLMDSIAANATAGADIDVVATYAAPIASRALAEALGVDGVDFDRFQRWGDELVDRMYDRAPAPFSELHPELAQSLQELIDAHRDDFEARDDYMSKLMQAGMSDAMVRTQAMQLIVAGNETTRSMIGNCLRRLADDSDLYAAVRADRSLIPGVIEESLRFDAPIQVNGRFTQRETSLDGVRMDVREHLILGIGCANRDEAVFDRPQEFVVDRARPKDHLTFGAGPHVCPGAFLARHEGVVAVEVFVDRIRSMTPATTTFDGNPIFWAMAPLSLLLKLEPVPG